MKGLIYRFKHSQISWISVYAIFCLLACSSMQTKNSKNDDEASSEKILGGVFAKPPTLKERSVLTAWFTAPAMYAKTEDDVRLLIEKSSVLGIKKIYVSVWYRGCTAFTSKVVSGKGGPAKCDGFDWLTPMKAAAQKFKIDIIPWLEWGLHIPQTSQLSVKGGLKIVESEIWQGVAAPRLNLFDQEVSLFFSDLIMEAAYDFNAKEVQICDNHALKKSQLALLKKTEVDFTNAILEMIKVPKSKGLEISIGALEHNAALENFGINWPKWKKDSLVVEVISELYHLRSYPQLYRGVAKAEQSQGAKQIGIYTGTLGGWTDQQFIDFYKINSELGLGTAIFEIGSFLKNKTHDDIKKLVAELSKI